MKNNIAVILLIVSILVISGCSPKETSEKYTGPVEKITLGVAKSVLPSLVWIAENKSYFKENGVEVSIKEFDSGLIALKTMLNESGLDMVTTAQTPIMFSSFTRSDFVIVTGIFSSYNDVFVLALRDRGITKPEDLHGKKIGVSIGSTGHYFLNLFLNNYNLQLQEVEIVDLPASKLVPDLIEGTIDAISVWQPHIYNAEQVLGNKSITFPNENIFREDFYFVANRQFIQNHSKAIIRFLQAIKQAEEFAKNNKDESVAIVSTRLGINKDFVSSVWNDFQLRLFLDQTIIQVLEWEARWAISNNLTNTTKIPNYLDYFYFDALEKVKPEAVTIIR